MGFGSVPFAAILILQESGELLGLLGTLHVQVSQDMFGLPTLEPHPGGTRPLSHTREQRGLLQDIYTAQLYSTAQGYCIAQHEGIT